MAEQVKGASDEQVEALRRTSERGGHYGPSHGDVRRLIARIDELKAELKDRIAELTRELDWSNDKLVEAAATLDCMTHAVPEFVRDLLRRLREELDELAAVLAPHDALVRPPASARQTILAEAADVANFAMMIADASLTLDYLPARPAPEAEPKKYEPGDLILGEFAKLREENDQLRRERDDLRGKLDELGQGPPTSYHSNGEAGDGQDCCDVCGHEDGHSWKECALVSSGQAQAADERYWDMNQRLTEAEKQRDEAVRAKDGAYSERNKLVAALSKVFPSSLERHPDSDTAWEDDWRWIVFVDLPAGQATWHIHDRELSMFDHLPRDAGRRWDGHTTEQKYARLANLGADFLATLKAGETGR